MNKSFHCSLFFLATRLGSGAGGGGRRFVEPHRPLEERVVGVLVKHGGDGARIALNRIERE